MDLHSYCGFRLEEGGFSANDSTHDYGEDFADAVLKVVPNFIVDALSLASTIEKQGDG